MTDNLEPRRATEQPASPLPGSEWPQELLPSRKRRFSMVTTLIAINVVIWLVQQQSAYWNDRIYNFGALQTAVVMQGQIWRLITAQYLHAGFFHLAVNMVALHFLGRPLEDLWGTRKFLSIYTVCGLCGNLFFVILGSRQVIDPHMVAVGASGCIYGLLGIVAVLFPEAEIYIYFLFPVKIRTAAVIMGGIAVMAVIERDSNYGGQACHLAGLVFGVWWALHGDEWWNHSEWVWSRRK